jgi:hypothetical protein
MKHKYYSQIQTLSINVHGLWACDSLTQTTLFTFRESVTYKIRKTQRSRHRISLDVARENTPSQLPMKCRVRRINPKSTDKRGKIRWQMKKLFETEIISHWMAAILITDLYSKLERLEHWKLSLRCDNANSISQQRKKQGKNRKTNN